MRRIALGLAAALAFAGGANAAPLPSKPDAGTRAEKIACYWRNGVRLCDRRSAYRRYYRGPAYGYYTEHGLGRSQDYRVGSTEWWRAKDRECTGGYRC